MVRGWQSRVEKAGARREASKQRKQKQINRSAHKAMVQGLLAFLEKHSQVIRRRADPTWNVHLWVDSLPSDSPHLLDTEEDLEPKGKRNGRSLGDEPKGNGKGRCDSPSDIPGSAKKKSQARGQSGSINKEAPASAKKNGNQRSKEIVLEGEDDDKLGPVLCKTQFYTGKCDDLKGGKNKIGCRCFHYPKGNKTLADVLKANKKKDTDEVLEILAMSEQSLLEATQDDGYEVGGMEMLYYSSVGLIKGVPEGSSDDANPHSASEIVAKAMADKAIAAANVVYVAINDVLIFDRYRDGVIISDQTMMTAVLGDDERRSRSTSLALSVEGDGEKTLLVMEDRSVLLLPGHILEYILTYLCDKAVATMCRVCQSWNTEIDSASPEMWRNMLRRRCWPVADDIGDIDLLQEQLRSDFILHYTAVRDVDAIKDAMGILLGIGKRAAIEESEMVYQAFSTRRTAPQEPNVCVATEVWSTNQMLSAYSHDCTLRLFQALDKSLEGGSSRSCREVVCVCVDPFRKTKKQTTTLLAMGLDEERIGCLCRVKAGTVESYILTVVTRDDYLSSDGYSGVDLEEGVLKVINIGEAFLNYFLFLDESEGQLHRLSDYLSDGGHLSEVEVLVSPSVAACGRGRFLVEVSVSIPSVADIDEDDVRGMDLVGRKLGLICSSRGFIDWIGDIKPSQVAQTQAISCLKSTRYSVGGSTCSIVATFASSPLIFCTTIESNGYVQPVQTLKAAEIAWSEMNENGWNAHPCANRPTVVTDTDIVAAYSLSQHVNEDRIQSKSIISFYPRFADDVSYQTIQLDGNCMVLGMQPLRDHHIALLCIIHDFTGTDGNDALGQGNGDLYSEPFEHRRLFAVLLHIPSRREIHRVCLVEDDGLLNEFLPSHHLPLYIATDGDTVGVGVFWKGVMMTGSDVRDLGANYGLDAARLLTFNKQLKTRKLKKKTDNRKAGCAHGRNKGYN